ncbi:MAG TPA: hypothetical protein VFX24_01655 [Ktedonobacterales bacterium]|nr:hypothetical protein [Ktedonobacterales bacterium]
MRGTFGTLDARQLERMRQALAETLCTHFASPPFFDPRLGTDRVRPLDSNSVDAVGHFVQSVNYSALDAIDVSSNEVRRFLEGLFLRYLQVNPAFKSPRHARYLPALRARVPRLAADVHRALLASLEGKAPNFGAPPRKQSWTEGRERARKLSQEDYERTTRILEAAIIRSRIDDYSNSGFVPQAEPADVARRPPALASPVANPSPSNDQWLNTNTANDLTVPVSATGFAAAFGALGINATGTQPAPPQPVSGSRRPTDQPTSPMPAASIPSRNGAAAPRELPEDLYELYGDYLQDMQPDTTVTPAVSSRPAPSYPAASHLAAQSHPQSYPAVPRSGAAPAAAPWQSAPNSPPVPAPTPRPPQPQPQPHSNGQPANPSTHADQMVFWQLRYQLEAYVRRAAESYGLSYNGSDPSAVLDALRQSGFVDEADLRIAEGILALTDRVTRSSNVAMEDYRQAFLLYLLYHRSHLGI